MKYTAKELKENVNVSKTSPLKDVVILSMEMLGLFVLIYLALGFSIDAMVTHLPQDAEHRLSTLFVHHLVDKPPMPTEQSLQTFLERLITVLPQESQKKYQVHVVLSKQTNALALPGGHIVILSGLLKELQSENELAFVLGHEVGHFVNRDHLRRLGRGLVLSTVSIFLTGLDSNLTQFLMRSLVGIELKFSREQELKADLQALELLNKYYGHVAGATDFFERIATKNSHSRLSYYFATHPYPQERVIALQEKIQKNNYLLREKIAINQVLENLPETTAEISLEDFINQRQ